MIQILDKIQTSKNSSMRFLKNVTSRLAEGSEFPSFRGSFLTILFHFLIRLGFRQSSVYISEDQFPKNAISMYTNYIHNSSPKTIIGKKNISTP